MVSEAMRENRSLRKFFFDGLLGGVFATALTFAGTKFLSLPFPPEFIFQILIAPVPGSIQSVAVETLREYAKYATFAFATAIYVLVYPLLAVLLGIQFRKDLQGIRVLAPVLGAMIPTAIGLGLDGLLATRYSTLYSLYGWFIAGLLLLTINAAYSIISFRQGKAPVRGVVEEKVTIISPSRRRFIKRIGIAGAALAGAGVVARVGLSVLSGEPLVRSDNPIPISKPETESSVIDLPPIFRDERISDLVASEITDNRVFYRVDINPFPPQLDFEQWSLKISGRVNNQIILNKASLMALPTKEEYATLECVSNTINPPGGLISNAKWTGVPLRTILDRAGVSPNAKYVVFHCADGYSVGIPLDRALRPDALLAYMMNDELLPDGHGFPLRAIVPGIYGMMNAKWITEIQVLNQIYLGYWQFRGWSNNAKITTTSIIYYPQADARVNGRLPIAGIAFAGDGGISKVEVSVDGGKTWDEAVLKKPHSQNSWALWAYEWNPTSPGDYTITARAYDGAGEPQDPTVRQAFPEGATGYHIVHVTVT